MFRPGGIKPRQLLFEEVEGVAGVDEVAAVFEEDVAQGAVVLEEVDLSRQGFGFGGVVNQC